MRLLILTLSILLCASYTQAERWRGLISSVAAVEVAKTVKVETTKVIPQKQVTKTVEKVTESKTELVCRDGRCTLLPRIRTKKVEVTREVEKETRRQILRRRYIFYSFRLFRRG